jgi:hypothetical protein
MNAKGNQALTATGNSLEIPTNVKVEKLENIYAVA